MMPDKTYRLRWENISSELDLLSSFRDLRENGTFFDVSLSCSDGYGGGKTIRAHKVILSSYSSVFREMLSRHPNQNDPLIYLQGITFDIADKLIEFMYKGEVNVSEKVLATFMDIAEDLKIKGLKSKKDKAAINRFIKNDSKDQTEPLFLQRDDILSKYKKNNEKMQSMVSEESDDARQPIKKIKPDFTSASSLYSNLSEELLKPKRSEVLSFPNKHRPQEDVKPIISSMPTKTATDDFITSPGLNGRLEDLYFKIDRVSVRPDGRKTYYSKCKVCGREGRTDDIRKHIRRNHQANMSEEAGSRVKSEFNVDYDAQYPEDPIDTTDNTNEDFNMVADFAIPTTESNVEEENEENATRENPEMMGKIEELMEKLEAFIPPNGGGKRYRGRCRICGKEARIDEVRNHIKRHHSSQIIE